MPIFGRSYRRSKSGKLRRNRREELRLSWGCCWAVLTRRPEKHSMLAGPEWPGVCLWCGKNDDEYYARLEAALDKLDAEEASERASKQEFEERVRKIIQRDKAILDRLGDT